MEPLTIIGGVAASAQLTSIGISLAISVARLPSKIKSAPDALKSLMEDVEGYLATLRSFSLECRDSEDSLTLQARIDRCTSSATQLKGMLEKMAFQDKDTKWLKFIKAIVIQCKAKTIAKSLADFERRKGVLNGVLNLHIYK